MIRFKCAGCGRQLAVPVEHAGKKSRCKNCGTISAIPSGPSGTNEPSKPAKARPKAASRDRPQQVASPVAKLVDSPGATASSPPVAVSVDQQAMDASPANTADPLFAPSPEPVAGNDNAGEDLFGDLPEFSVLEQEVPKANRGAIAEELMSQVPTEVDLTAVTDVGLRSPGQVEASETEKVQLDEASFADALVGAEQLVNADVARQHAKNAYAASAKLTPEQIAASFVGDIPPIERERDFGGSLSQIATGMFLVPGAFLAFVVIATLGVLVGFVGIVSAGVLNPLIVGLLVLIAFVVISSWSPAIQVITAFTSLFFSRQEQHPGTRTVTRKEQPVLYAFVDEICKKLDAPPPARIDLDCEYNASASYADSWSNFQDNYVLTIGVPLIASHSSEQLASVIAHEFGHFCQTSAMRAHYAVRYVNSSFINAAIRKAVFAEIRMYNVANSDHGSIFDVFIYWGGALGRKMLWWMGYAGHAISGKLSREMEYDADRYAVQLAGANTFQKSMTSVAKHGVAHSITVDNLKMLFEYGVLVNNIPRFMMHVAKTLPGATVRRLADQMEKEKQEAFDSHPPMRDRVAAANELGGNGIIRMKCQARDLIFRWNDLCEAITLDFYTGVTGREIEQKHVTKLEDVLAAEHKLLLDKV